MVTNLDRLIGGSTVKLMSKCITEWIRTMLFATGKCLWCIEMHMDGVIFFILFVTLSSRVLLLLLLLACSLALHFSFGRELLLLYCVQFLYEWVWRCVFAAVWLCVKQRKRSNIEWKTKKIMMQSEPIHHLRTSLPIKILIILVFGLYLMHIKEKVDKVVGSDVLRPTSFCLRENLPSYGLLDRNRGRIWFLPWIIIFFFCFYLNIIGFLQINFQQELWIQKIVRMSAECLRLKLKTRS